MDLVSFADANFEPSHVERDLRILREHAIRKEPDMGKILKNVAPFWKMVIVILIFLVLQAYCDLSLPTFTSNIIDVGVTGKGIEYVMPEKITFEEYKYLEIFMTEDEQKIWESNYKETDSGYQLKDLKKSTLESMDEKFATVLLMNGQMAKVDHDGYAQIVAMITGKDAKDFENISLEEMVSVSQIQLEVTKTEVERNGKTVLIDTVDLRPALVAMRGNGTMPAQFFINMRETVEEKMSALGENMLLTSAKLQTAEVEKNAGINIKSKQKSYLWKAGFIMLGLALLMALSTVVVGYFASKIGAGVGRNLRERVFKKVVGFSNTEINQFSTASLITRSTNDVQQVQLVTTLLLRMIAYAPILGIGGIIKVYTTGASMGWVIACAVLVILGLVGFLMGVAMPKFKAMQKLIDRVNLILREILTGLSVIRAFGREQKEVERFDVANVELTKTMLFTNRVMAFMMPGMMMVMYGLSVAIVWVGSHKIDEGVLQAGTMIAFLTYAILIVMSFLMLSVMAIFVPRASVAAGRIDEVEKTEFSIENPENPELLENVQGKIEFKNVSFCYPGAEEDALEDISFVAEPGKTTAIIGSTGCGKSTLVQMIPRLYDVTDGEILFDGVDIRNMDMKQLRKNIGFVPQKGVLFSGTIASNLRYGNAAATQEEIEEAAEIAQATEFIEKKELKYEDKIAQGGNNVSGGQKQRIAIARAIAKKANVYIFDDSFSALDLKTDGLVRKALKEKVKDATVIIVAQRISTILHADQILVMDDGKIVGKGTHEELLKNCDVYLQIATSQLSGKELGVSGKEENANE